MAACEGTGGISLQTYAKRTIYQRLWFKDQIRRAVVSVPSNIAEGDERGSNKEAIRFFYIAKGSLAEIQTQLKIAYEIEYLDKSNFNELGEKCLVIGKMLGSLIKARSQKINIK